MRVEGHTIILSRYNLMSLLAKLDGYPPNSACTLLGGDEALQCIVKAEEDDVHYARPRGKMHPFTEEFIDIERNTT